MDNSLKIFCITHTHDLWPEIVNRINNDPVITPLKCGSKDHETGDLRNVLFDDVGDNISYLNRYLNEITGIYWLWKHYEEIGNPDYVGVCHYRRFFNPEDISDYRKFGIINISNKPIFPMSIYQQYCSNRNHDKELFDFMIDEASKMLRVNVSEYFTNRYNLFKMCNMFIMRRELFMEYCTFIDKLRELACAKVDPTNTLKDRSFEDGRIISFALERMSSFWMDYFSMRNRWQTKTLLDIEYFKVKPW